MLQVQRGFVCASIVQYSTVHVILAPPPSSWLGGKSQGFGGEGFEGSSHYALQQVPDTPALSRHQSQRVAPHTLDHRLDFSCKCHCGRVLLLCNVCPLYPPPQLMLVVVESMCHCAQWMRFVSSLYQLYSSVLVFPLDLPLPAETYRLVFSSFEYFNLVQSKVFDDVSYCVSC